MSYNTHKRQALDAASPLAHRASHARSCVLHVANAYHVHRDEILQRVKRLSSVDLLAVSTEEELGRAVACLDALREPSRDASVSRRKRKAGESLNLPPG